MMIKFKELFKDKAFNHALDFPSVSATFGEHCLQIRFDSKDFVVTAGYTGKADPWLSSLCYIIQSKSLAELLVLNRQSWKEVFKKDSGFWEFYQDEEEKFLCYPCELLKFALDIYEGREYLYQEDSPLVCRCFGIRESDILEHLQKEDHPTLESLAGSSKAGMGCRSCVPQLQKWMSQDKKPAHYFKQKPLAEWVLMIEEALETFPEARPWKMEVERFKGHQVMISFEKEVSQKEEEQMSLKLQRYLGEAVDGELAFFLRRARHFSKARG